MQTDTERELEKMTCEAAVYKQIAAYMTQFHIATAWAFLSIKSTSAYERKRLRNIVETCKQMLEGMALPAQFGSGMYHADDKVKEAVERAKKFLEEHP